MQSNQQQEATQPAEQPQPDSQEQAQTQTAELPVMETAQTLDQPNTPQLNAQTEIQSGTIMSGQDAAILDVLKTESLLRALYNLRYGKVDPERLDADFNYPPARSQADQSAQLLDWIRNGQIEAALEDARPKHQAYLGLKEALKRFRDLATTGGWPEIPAGKGLKPGMKDARIPLIRQRLAVDINPELPLDSEDYDEPMVEAVKAFQQNYGIEGDGIIGPATIRALSQSVQSRTDQIRVNLERERWFNPESIPEYLAIDVAGYRLRWWRDGAVIWDERVQVGKARSPTPIFRDELEHLVFNPDWSVPPSINRRTILPSLKMDPGYLDKKGYLLLDERGNQIDPYSVDWNALNRMPYIVRQPPGPGNALGRVKFMFPNKHHVFLHDTNHPELFRKDVRTTSSGCVRLRDPFELAQRLLAPQEDWNRGRIDNLIASHATTQVNLKRRLPIVIFYSTVAALPDGLSFRDDIYGRDPEVLAFLDGPFSLHLPELSKAEQERVRKTLASASTPLNIAAEPEVIGTPVQMEIKSQAAASKDKQKDAWNMQSILGF
jgi:murein L,D-transpeptidase YcbB/YkuD